MGRRFPNSLPILQKLSYIGFAEQLIRHCRYKLLFIELVASASFPSHKPAPAYNARLKTLIANLARFPAMGRLFLERPIRSVEASNGIDALQGKLPRIDCKGENREVVLEYDLMLYAFTGKEVFLLAIRQHKQLSFDCKAFS